MEGNAVVAPDGALLDILRVDNVEKAALVRLHGDRLEFDRFIAFPGGAKKFTIRYDPKLSMDLLEWRIDRILLTHPDPLKHAFQYVDWQFDGPDIVAVLRTAFDDDAGGAASYHDANYLTFLRVLAFRQKPPSQ